MGGREEESVGGAKSAGVAANGPPDQRTSTNKPQPTMLKKKNWRVQICRNGRKRNLLFISDKKLRLY